MFVVDSPDMKSDLSENFSKEKNDLLQSLGTRKQVKSVLKQLGAAAATKAGRGRRPQQGPAQLKKLGVAGHNVHHNPGRRG